jgi:dihydropteroate synthase
MSVLKHARGELQLDHCLVMGIVNRTPDSFYEGHPDLGEAAEFAARLVNEGADILDVGAVKAGPGDEVSEAEEIDRLIPFLEQIAARTSVPLSVETASPEVARRAIEAGASIVNDVRGLEDPELASMCASAGAGLVVMHHGGQVRGRPRWPRYDDVVTSVLAFWEERIAAALEAGVARESIVVDPGLDFGKTTFHSLELVRRIDELIGSGWPVLIAHSRKDIVGETLGQPPDERLEGGLAVAALSVLGGAAVLRTHDVAATVSVVRMVEAVMGRRPPAAPVRGLWD